MKKEQTFNQMVGEKLRNLRNLRGMRQQDVVEKLIASKDTHYIPYYISRQTISKYENGERGMTLEMLFNLAKILEVPVSYFFTSEEDQKIFHNDSEGIVTNEKFSLNITMNPTFSKLSNQEKGQIIDDIIEELHSLKNTL